MPVINAKNQKTAEVSRIVSITARFSQLRIDYDHREFWWHPELRRSARLWAPDTDLRICTNSKNRAYPLVASLAVPQA